MCGVRCAQFRQSCSSTILERTAHDTTPASCWTICILVIDMTDENEVDDWLQLEEEKEEEEFESD